MFRDTASENLDEKVKARNLPILQAPQKIIKV